MTAHSAVADVLHTAQWGNVPAWVAAGISLIFGITSWRSSRKSSAERDEARRQAERAERAAGAAEREAGAAERSAAVAEARERRETAQTEDAEADPWELEPIPGVDSYYLINTTTTAKYAVTVEGARVHDSPVKIDIIGPGRRVDLVVMPFGQLGSSVEISWYQRQDRSDWLRTRKVSIPIKTRPRMIKARR